MELTTRGVAGRVAYGAAFTLALPLLLVAWARAAAGAVPLSVPGSPALGVALLAGGVALALAGMGALWTRGGGLPMNAYPPPHLVRAGVYALVPHPIYVGACAAAAGIAIATGSGAGLWLVTPTLALGCAALVLGHERLDLAARFGPGAAAGPRLARDDEGAPTRGERASAYVLVLLPWAVGYEALLALGPGPDAVPSYLPLEAGWPVLAWATPVYTSAYAAVLAAPIVARSARALRRFEVAGLVAMGIAFPIQLVAPLSAPPRPFDGTGLAAGLLAAERALDGPGAAFPSFHVIWAILAVGALARGSAVARSALLAWAGAVAASCLATGMHSLADVAAGLAVAALALRAGQVWEALRSAAERAANSWREWRFGPARVIVHAAWAGLAGAVGGGAVVALAGERATLAAGVVVLGAVVGAGLWAQFVEGSPQLLRPFGFYGSILGVIGALAAARPLGSDPWLLFAATTVAAPWVQALGRVRCLVQGCCHGRPAPPGVGIRYTHPRSRVTRLAHLAGVPVHPTPLYSILWSVMVGAALVRLWSLHAPAHLIVGAYFVLSGTGRFVEEAYRGEPQTAVVARLSLYQWLAVASTVGGAAVTALGAGSPVPPASPSVGALFIAFAAGLLCAFAYGVDFPGSSRRFSRLA